MTGESNKPSSTWEDSYKWPKCSRGFVGEHIAWILWWTNPFLFGELSTLVTENERLNRLVDRLQQTIQMLEARNELHRRELEMLEMIDSVIHVGKDGTIMEVNAKILEESWYTREELIGKNMRFLSSKNHPPEFWRDFWDTIHTGRTWAGTICNKRKDGTTFWLQSVVKPIMWSDGKIQKFLAAYHDISREVLLQKQNEDLLRKIWWISWTKDLQDEIHETKGKVFILISISNLADINTSFGPIQWDQAVLKVMEALTKMKEWELFKLWWAEFAMVFPDEKYKMMAWEIQQTLISLNFPVPLSICVSGIVTDGSSWWDLLNLWYLALSQSKANWRSNIYETSDLPMGLHDSNLRISRSIDQAFENDLIVPFWQVIYDREQKPRKVEILMRAYADKERTIILPPWVILPFINASEKSRREMTERMVRKSFSFLQEREDVEFSINVWTPEIQDPEFIWHIKERIEEYNIRPNRVVFEILEEVISLNNEEVASFIYELKLLGCKIAIDDFWKDYSGTKRMRSIGLDYCKVDIWLVKEIDKAENQTNRQLISDLVSMAHNRNMQVIAEGVETEDEFRTLMELGIDLFQWYYFHRPAPLEQLIEEGKI